MWWPQTSALATLVVISGCTANFWGLRTGVLGGAVTGDIEGRLTYADGCNDLDVLGINDDGDLRLKLSMIGPLDAMHSDKDRLRTLLVDKEESFTLILQSGTGLYTSECYGDYDDDYYYGYEEDPYDSDSYGEEVRSEYVYASGDIRMSVTARSRRWDFLDDPVHVKLHMEDMTFVERETGEEVYMDSAILQTYIYQWYYW